MDRKELEAYIGETYNVDADYPFSEDNVSAVFRHGNNRKWFALVMRVPREKLGLREGGAVDILNVKCDPILTGSLRSEPGVFPAYHMSKTSWLSVALDGTARDDLIKMLLDMSFDLTAAKVKKRKKREET